MFLPLSVFYPSSHFLYPPSVFFCFSRVFSCLSSVSSVLRMRFPGSFFLQLIFVTPLSCIPVVLATSMSSCPMLTTCFTRPVTQITTKLHVSAVDKEVTVLVVPLIYPRPDMITAFSLGVIRKICNYVIMKTLCSQLTHPAITAISQLR